MKKRLKKEGQLCPCDSQKRYAVCCRPFHQGKALPPTAEALMRSRYSAYAKGLADYIIDTTDPKGPVYQLDRAKWRSEIDAFSGSTTFEKLEILEVTADQVMFRAHLRQEGRPTGFIEKSRFRLSDGRWLYTEGLNFPNP